MPFSKGDKNIVAGRKKGAKDQKWATLEYWFTELQKSLNDPNLQVSDRVKAQLKCCELIMAKRNLPNESVEESVNNAAQLMKELKELETKFDNDNNSQQPIKKAYDNETTDKTGLECREPKI